MADPVTSPSLAPPHRLEPVQAAQVRVLQLTDCHILAGAEDCLKGVNTRASFAAVCERAIADNPVPDLVLATGDLSQDASATSYDYLAQRFAALGPPVFWLPGNHDDPELMRERLAGDNIFAAKQVLVGNWTILLLDSTVPGETGGCLAESQLDFLDNALAAQADRHALVCLHHHPLPAGSEWMDRLGLERADRFIERVTAHTNLRGVLWGHVHQQAHHHIDGVDWMSTPSTCVQFRPGSRDFALDDLGPGYRYLTLCDDGRIDSGVARIDMPATGRDR